MSTNPGLEPVTASRWVMAMLTASADLQALAAAPNDADAVEARVWEGTAPEDVTDPWWITFTVVEGRDVKVVGGIHIMTHVPVQVKVTGLGASYEPIIPVWAAVNAALENQQNVPVQPAGLVLTSTRVSTVKYPERANGVEYRHLGGAYETVAQ